MIKKWLIKNKILIIKIFAVIAILGLIFLYLENSAKKNIGADDLNQKILTLETKIKELEVQIKSTSTNQEVITSTNAEEIKTNEEDIEKININTALQAEFETIPGIGPTKAQAIIDYRNTNGSFASIEDIENVKGIGPATYDKIADYLTIEE